MGERLPPARRPRFAAHRSNVSWELVLNTTEELPHRRGRVLKGKERYGVKGRSVVLLRLRKSGGGLPAVHAEFGAGWR